MKMNSLKYLIAILSVFFVFAGCNEFADDDFPRADTDGVITVRLKPDQLNLHKDMETPVVINDSSIDHVIGYRFSQGVFREAILGEHLGDNEFYTFYVRELAGEIYFMANADTDIFGTLIPDISSLDEFLNISASVEAMTERSILMTGRMELVEGMSNIPTIRMRRSVARVDIVSQDYGVEVLKVTVRGVADHGYVNERHDVETPDVARRSDFLKDYADTPLINGKETLFYLCEQSGDPLSVEIIARFGGGLHRMVTALPSKILRNRIYALQVHGEGANLSVTVSTGDWEEGDRIDAVPDLKGLVDVEASVLTEGVEVNDSRDSVYVSYRGGEFRLALRAEADSEIDIEGIVDGVSVISEPVSRELQPVASVSVSSRRRIPDEKHSYIYLDVRRNDVYSGRIVLVFEPHPVQIEGLVGFDDTGSCDFDKYIDGELGRIVLPEGKIARVEFDAGEDPWMQLVYDDTVRILGGWKPNDPKADGRIQSGWLVFSDTDGFDVERYLISRRNWGLPVVRIGDRWWCKYNLRGNVKEFGDQISIHDDLAISGDLADYLNTCDDDELLKLMGDQYQAGNKQGLPLKHDGTAFYYEGMNASGQNFGTLDPREMAPDGYQIPDYDDYAFFSGSNNFNIGGVGVRTYRNAAGEEINVRIIERDANFLGHNYGIVSFYEFRSESDAWVLYGLGHQWNTAPGNIARMMLLLATYGNSANCWVMEGYAQNDRPGQNWLKFMNQNSTKTRVIRCVKSPVEYIYD